MNICQSGEITLYLWRNSKTVVVGRNQNIWRECRPDALSENCGSPARRLSGGGAVYHDPGNVNFTFITSAEDHDVSRQLTVVAGALSRFGLDAEVSGRNDILIGGRKFSGNAFFKKGGCRFHHGTIMLDVDTGEMARYLAPPREKLEAKGIRSVRSRVVNLRELCPSLTPEALEKALVDSLRDEYGIAPKEKALDAQDKMRISALRERYASWDWIYGRQADFTVQMQKRFSWGGAEIDLKLEAGVITSARVCSDALEWEIFSRVEKALAGKRYDMALLAEAVASLDSGREGEREIIADISAFFAKEAIGG